MELLLAGPARLLRQGVVGAVDDGEADHAVFNSLKALVHVVLPQSQSLHYTAILNTVMLTPQPEINLYLLWYRLEDLVFLPDG